MAAYGEMDEKGAIITDSLTCAVTGAEITAGDALVRIAGSRYFYRIKAGLVSKLSDEDKAKLAEGAPSAPKLTTKDGK